MFFHGSSNSIQECLHFGSCQLRLRVIFGTLSAEAFAFLLQFLWLPMKYKKYLFFQDLKIQFGKKLKAGKLLHLFCFAIWWNMKTPVKVQSAGIYMQTQSFLAQSIIHTQYTVHIKMHPYFKKLLDLFFTWYILNLYMTRNRLRVAFESGKGVKVKVVKWCWKKWNGPILMHISAKQCEIMQKNQWKGSNGQIHCFCKGKSAPRC